MRRRNEDAVYAGQYLFAVADGLGGHVAGDIASTTVIEALRPYDQPVDPRELPDVLKRAVHVANQALAHRIEANSDLDGMGTTLVAMLISGTAAVLANAGDCRAYRRRDGRLCQLTEDHTYAHLVAEAASVPNLSGRIARYLDGRADGRSPDITTCTLRPGDRFLLCSDGLSGVVPPELIHNSLTSSTTPAEVADRLISLAVDHGGPDNITMIVIDVSDTPSVRRG